MKSTANKTTTRTHTTYVTLVKTDTGDYWMYGPSHKSLRAARAFADKEDPDEITDWRIDRIETTEKRTVVEYY